VGLLQEAALFAADWLIVPSAVDYAATEGLAAVVYYAASSVNCLTDNDHKSAVRGVSKALK